MAIVGYLQRKWSENPWPIVAVIGTAIFLAAHWAFGWGYPPRGALEDFLSYTLAVETTVAAFKDDGSEELLGKSDVAAIGEIDCHRESRRYQPSITYTCFYNLAGVSGTHYRMVLVAVHNRGWKRNGMASVGNYRVTSMSHEAQRLTFARFEVPLPIAPQAD